MKVDLLPSTIGDQLHTCSVISKTGKAPRDQTG
jgi:hypothetical protein